jgi:hypothetical protein
MKIEFDREVDGRWICEFFCRRRFTIVYGKTRLTSLVRALWAIAV